jgi:5'-3' exonuclease
VKRSNKIILIDNNQIILSSIFTAAKTAQSEDDYGFIRHLVLNTYRKYLSKFRRNYGELIICNDSKNVWRKDFFPQYKKNRSERQKKSKFDWGKIFNELHTIREEMKDVFPYRFVQVERAEADDIIAVIAKNFHHKEKIMIVSSDKDFQQLQRYPNVEQYSPSKKGILRCDDPYDFLLDHVVRGDSSDGVPNAISDDAVFVEGRRQTRLTNKKIEELKEVGFQQEDNFMERNQKLIDLTMVPDYIEEETMRQMETEVSGDRSKILEYMMKYRLRSLIDNLEDF